MDPPLSTLLDELDEPLAPSRSPSRLDFCLECPEQGDSSPTDELDVIFRDCSPYTFIDEDVFADDTAPLDHPHIPIEDPPLRTDSPIHGIADTPPECQMNQVTFEPQAPVPVRPPSVQPQVDTQDYSPPPRTAAQRLNYPHHGFSRSALLQQKTFWNSRHEEWAEWQSRVEQGEAGHDAYTGFAIPQQRVVEGPPPYMRTPPSGLERDLVDLPPRKHEQDAPPSIYPRVGDISALRDQYSAHVDRCFFKFPLWTLQKTLYVLNMQQRTTPLAPFESTSDTAHVQASTSLSTLSSYTSSSSSDDEESDSTLVADEIPAASVQPPLGPSKTDSSSCSPPSWTRLRAWELSWYARWELLLGLFERDRSVCDILEMSARFATPLGSMTRPLLHSLPTFGFPEVDEDEDDEDDDYGIPLANSSFHVDFEDECQRAMAFYGRESKCLEMTM